MISPFYFHLRTVTSFIISMANWTRLIKTSIIVLKFLSALCFLRAITSRIKLWHGKCNQKNNLWFFYTWLRNPKNLLSVARKKYFFTPAPISLQMHDLNKIWKNYLLFRNLVPSAKIPLILLMLSDPKSLWMTHTHYD